MSAVLYSHPMIVPFQDIDAAGIVFFARIFDYFHNAFVAHLRARGVSLPEVIAGGEWEPCSPMLKPTTNFRCALAMKCVWNWCQQTWATHPSPCISGLCPEAIRCACTASERPSTSPSIARRLDRARFPLPCAQRTRRLHHRTKARDGTQPVALSVWQLRKGIDHHKAARSLKLRKPLGQRRFHLLLIEVYFDDQGRTDQRPQTSSGIPNTSASRTCGIVNRACSTSAG